MSNILVKSPKEEKEIKTLLNKELPSYRQAYSDRTSWLMACISELAYVKFNPILKDKTKDYFIKKISEFIDENKKKSLLKLIELVGYDHKVERKKLEENAELLNLKLVKTFDSDGTQAIFLENDKYIFLGFRGTEATSIKDIKTDANAIMKACETGGKIHSGFNDAFDKVYLEITNTLENEEYKDKPLFITGHSLGGALATVATKKLTHKGGIAACYTFGSPRVGDSKWTSNIKTSVYRLVNAADPVTMLPPGGSLVDVCAWILGLTPKIGKRIKNHILSKFGDYLHAGNMRYLTNCSKSSDYSDVKLLYSVTWFFRMKAFFKQKAFSFLKMPADHSISTYRRKLKIIATNRNTK